MRITNNNTPILKVVPNNGAVAEKNVGGDLEMKMKKGLLMVVLLLALSSIMAAMSYKRQL